MDLPWQHRVRVGFFFGERRFHRHVIFVARSGIFVVNRTIPSKRFQATTIRFVRSRPFPFLPRFAIFFQGERSRPRKLMLYQFRGGAIFHFVRYGVFMGRHFLCKVTMHRDRQHPHFRFLSGGGSIKDLSMGMQHSSVMTGSNGASDGSSPRENSGIFGPTTLIFPSRNGTTGTTPFLCSGGVVFPTSAEDR